MSALNLLSTCPTCGSEESIEAIIHRVLDEEKVRRLVLEVMEMSLPLGGKVIRYIRLHKPAKHVLRTEKMHALLAELVPDMRRGAVNVKGRDWVATLKTWADAFDEVFRAQNTGSLILPLQGNGYLYAVITRLSNSVEASEERAREIERQQRAYRATEAMPLAAALDLPVPAAPAPAAPVAPVAPIRREVPDWIKQAQQKLAASSAGVRTESNENPEN